MVSKLTDLKISIIGCGKLGTSLALAFKNKGLFLYSISTKTEESLRKANFLLKPEIAHTDAAMITSQADIIFITTPDVYIQEIFNHICRTGAIKNGAVITHCSGFYSSDILSSAFRNNCFTASTHPIQTFANAEQGIRNIKNIFWTIEGDSQALDVLKRLIIKIDGHPITIPKDKKDLYHIAAVFASNYLVTIMDAVFALAKDLNLNESQIFELFLPLINGTLENIKHQGIKNALTGPIARADFSTIREHLFSLKQKKPQYLPLYTNLALATLSLSLSNGCIDKSAGKKLHNIILKNTKISKKTVHQRHKI